MTVTVFGIRHHGPGCARSLDSALRELRPDLVLVEGPPDADELIPAVAAQGMVPPVAILTWCHDDPQQAAFHPFAVFSPEWRALSWALHNGVPARFCDLPMAQILALPSEAGAPEVDDPAARDPLQWLATADGYSDSERWWNDRIEEAASDVQLFAAIVSAIAAVRTELALTETRRTLLREAWMRQTLRAATKEGFANVAFVCGAWHAPAMSASTAAADAALLKGLPKVKVHSTWTPWTYERLTSASGYGAGVTAPGWYEHLFAHSGDVVPRWLVRAARVLRQEDVPTSCASVIEATRLSTMLASLRGRPVAGLPELDAAIRAVFCAGDTVWRQLLEKPLFVGERLGELPPDTARLPLESDLLATAKSLRLKQTAGKTMLELDLREDSGRARSTFLHRLLALRLPWGRKVDAGRTRGTFKEVWTLQWQPEFALALVDASAFGNTVEHAAVARLARSASDAQGLADLVPVLELALLAELPAAAVPALVALQERSALTHDVAALLDAIPPLVRLARYGNVRATDQDAVRGVLSGLVVRAHVGLAAAGAGLADEPAQALTDRVRAHHAALQLLADDALLAEGDAALQATAARDDVHPQLRGLAIQLLRTRRAITDDAAARCLQRELSAGAPPQQAAAWLDGFLGGHGQVLAHDVRLLQLLDDWVAALTDEQFQSALPLVRRTLASFAGPERRQIAQGLRSRRSGAPPIATAAVAPTTIDRERARPAVAALARLLGLPPPEPSP